MGMRTSSCSVLRHAPPNKQSISCPFLPRRDSHYKQFKTGTAINIVTDAKDHLLLSRPLVMVGCGHVGGWMYEVEKHLNFVQ